jgi:predicted adenylyl cyclase CyaB
MRLNELEIKISIGSDENFKKIYQLCIQSFGPPISHLKQIDEYFDTPDRQLKKHDLVVRIRSNGDKQTIALKSPRIDLPSGMTHRIELEFLAAEGEQIHSQLFRQGLNPTEVSEKERWTFIDKDCEIVLDKLPFIGSFIEIEGPSEEAIHKIVTLLQLTSHEVIRQNYGELMTEKFQELQLPLTNICATFAKEKEIMSL